MGKTGLEHLEETPAAEVRSRCELEPDALALLEAEMTALQYLEALVEHGQNLAAVQFLGNALEPRDAVWWAWDRAKDAAGESAPESERVALERIDAWLAAPDDASRREAYAAGQEAGLESPAGCAATAAFLCEGSISLPDLEEVLPPREACGRMAAGAILMAAALVPEQAEDRTRAAIDRWRELAPTPRPWKTGSEGAEPEAAGYDADLRL